MTHGNVYLHTYPRDTSLWATFLCEVERTIQAGGADSAVYRLKSQIPFPEDKNNIIAFKLNFHYDALFAFTHVKY